MNRKSFIRIFYAFFISFYQYVSVFYNEDKIIIRDHGVIQTISQSDIFKDLFSDCRKLDKLIKMRQEHAN